ncbi:MAG: hypothetical protein IIA61_11700 [Candidatus Marinimicrobia bacterium]|nr:hypothetical protein [Candidatus Neomarinimicrobiota bacterium]
MNESDSVILINSPDKTGAIRGQIIAEAGCFVRDLVSYPSNVVTPSRLALEVRKIARQSEVS